MKNLFIIEHSIEHNEAGGNVISLIRVELLRKSKKTYSVFTFEEMGKIYTDGNLFREHIVKDPYVLQYLNRVYLNETGVRISDRLIIELLNSGSKK